MIFLGLKENSQAKWEWGYSICSLELKLQHKAFGEIAYYDMFPLLSQRIHGH